MAHAMSLLGRSLFSLTHRLRGSRSLELYREIADAPRASREAALAEQMRLLSALLDHAERNVPYYREMFAALGIRSRDVRSLEDFARLPVLTKDIVRERQRDLVSEATPPERLFPQHSGGSTGVPVSFFRDRAYLDASDAGTYRNLAQCGWRPGDMVGFVWGSNARIERMSPLEFELRQRLRRFYLLDPFRSGPEELGRWIAKLRRLRPTAMLGYASTMARLAEYAIATGEQLPRGVRGVFTTAEKLYPQQRSAIERAFACHAFDLYGSSEVQNIAAECPAGSMHVNVDFVVLESDAAAGAPGGPTPLIVTSLRAYAMPFIRYRNEDCGTLLDGTCSCGGGFPLMSLDVARVSDNFVLPDGQVVHGEFFTHLMYGSKGVASFQFHQTAPDHIRLLMVPTAGDGADGAAGRAAAARKAVAEIQALSPRPIVVEVQEVASIPLSSAGKHRFTRTDVRAPLGERVESAAAAAAPAGGR